MDLVYEPGTQVALQRPGSDPARRGPRARGGRAARRVARSAGPGAARDEGHALPARRRRSSAHRADRGRPLARPRPARRGARRERFAIGGIAPHAGLFGTAPDLARFAQMLLNGGVYEHQRIVSRETVERFTRRAGVPGSSRALGWDTSSRARALGRRAACRSRSFGHTGFTGTSIWIDPERRLFVDPAHEPRPPDARERRDPRGAPATWPTRWCAALEAPATVAAPWSRAPLASWPRCVATGLERWRPERGGVASRPPPRPPRARAPRSRPTAVTRSTSCAAAASTCGGCSRPSTASRGPRRGRRDGARRP